MNVPSDVGAHRTHALILTRLALIAAWLLCFGGTALQAATFTVLHTFKGGKRDVHGPQTSLTKLGNALYGTTEFGDYNDNSAGTVFRITTDDGFRTIFSFQDGGTGEYPRNPLTAFQGVLYGTDSQSNSVYSLTKEGQLTNLHQFGGPGDGSGPAGGLVELNGVLYGTTSSGGANSAGTVYSITPQGDYAVLYSFGGPGDGNDPSGSLLAVRGELYGTTYFGGASGNGTVFSVTPAGQEVILYSFMGDRDGENPQNGLVSIDGKLFGTTNGGDLPKCANCGTVFSLTLHGHYRVIHRFHDDQNGSGPGALTAANGVLYGTTEVARAGSRLFSGTLFSLTPSGTFTLLYSFDTAASGNVPNSPLVYDDGLLYGTTQSGGSLPNGDAGGGTVFSLAP